jgi:hypothetical protein
MSSRIPSPSTIADFNELLADAERLDKPRRPRPLQHCGDEHRLCVRGDLNAGRNGKHSDYYVIKGLLRVFATDFEMSRGVHFQFDLGGPARHVGDGDGDIRTELEGVADSARPLSIGAVPRGFKWL